MKNKKEKITVLILSLLAVVLAAALVLLLTQRKTETKTDRYDATGYAMGSMISQTVYGMGDNAAKITAIANERAGSLEELISWRIEGSDIWKLNTNAGSTVSVNEKTLALLKTVLEVAGRSEGAFDPTILPLTSLWNFDSEAPQRPSDAQIQAFLPLVGFSHLTLGSDSAALDLAGCAVDLGAAGKGAACDEILDAYRKYSVSGAVVSVGGSVGVYGEKPDGKAWQIAVRDPFSENAEDNIGTITLSSGCASTSGSYEKCFTQDGVLYHHLLDPKTGMPANTGLVSVTVICESGALSDILSTACFVLGLEKGSALLSQYGASGIFITDEKKVHLVGDPEFKLLSDEVSLS